MTLHCAVTLIATVLYSITVDSGRSMPGQLAVPCSFPSIEVDIFEIEGVDMTRYVAEQRQTDIDA